MKKILALLSCLLFLGQTAFADFEAPNYWEMASTGTSILPNPTTLHIGNTSTRIAKGWFTDLDVSGVFTFGGTIVGPLLNSDGTAAAPSYSFSADTNTGIYRSSTDILGFSTGGVERLLINSNGRIMHTVNPLAAGQSGMLLNYTTAAGTTQTGINLTLSAGATSASNYDAVVATNSVLGTGTTFVADTGYGYRPNTRNVGLSGYTIGNTTGYNYGGLYLARGGNQNVGIWTGATVAKTNTVNVGIAAFGNTETKIEPISPDGTTATSTTAFKLIVSGQNFSTTVQIGDAVKNLTTRTFALVTAVDSDTQLSLDRDIFVSGNTYQITRDATGSARAIGGFFSLSGNENLVPVWGDSAALIADNASSIGDVFDARSNGVSSFRINSAGGIVEEFTEPDPTTGFPYTATIGDRYIYVDTDGGARTINLPPLTAVDDGFRLIIIDNDGESVTNPITIDANGTETINGNLTAMIQGEGGAISLQKKSDGWHIF